MRFNSSRYLETSNSLYTADGAVDGCSDSSVILLQDANADTWLRRADMADNVSDLFCRDLSSVSVSAESN